MSRFMSAPRHVLALTLLALGSFALGQVPSPPADGQPFEGTWSVTGRRHALPTGGARDAAVIELAGALVLTRGDGLSRGFQGEAIGFDDGRNLVTGRCVFTDEGGDRVFAELKGETLEARRRVAGTITGGTGRYAGLSGEFTFEWQYVVYAGEETIQARTVNLVGRYRLAAARR